VIFGDFDHFPPLPSRAATRVRWAGKKRQGPHPFLRALSCRFFIEGSNLPTHVAPWRTVAGKSNAESLGLVHLLYPKLSQDGSRSLLNGADVNNSGAWHYPLTRLVTLHGDISAVDFCTAPTAPEVTSASFAGRWPLNMKAAFQLAFS